MSAHWRNRSGQVSVCSVITVPFELDVSVGHSARQFEPRANIKLMCKLGKFASETLSVLSVILH